MTVITTSADERNTKPVIFFKISLDKVRLKQLGFTLTLLCFFLLNVHSTSAQNLTQEEIERARAVRIDLVERGLITTELPIEPHSIDIGDDRLLNFVAYMGESLSVPDGTSPRATEFQSNGKKMYVVGRESRKIIEYELSTAWDIGTASASGELDLNDYLGVTGEQDDFAAHGIYISKDNGRRLWVFNRTEIWEFDLSTAWNIESATNPQFTHFDEVVRGHDFDFSPDGQYLYIDDRFDGKIFQYRLDTPWEVNSAEIEYALDISSRQQAVRGIQFSDAGDKMFLLDTDAGDIYEYYLNNNFDISSASYLGSYRVGNRADEPTGLTFSPDFTRFYISSEQNDAVYQYKIQIVDADRSGLVSEAEKVVANGSAASRIEVTARDKDGDTISGVRISLNADGGSANIDVVRRNTNNRGMASFDVSHDEQETITLRASGMGVDISETVNVRFVTVDPDESSVAIDREKVLANGSASATVTVTARDEDGDTLHGVDIRLRASGEADVEIDNSSQRTNSDGEASFQVTGTSYGLVTLRAEGSGIEVSNRVSVRFVDVDPDESEMIADNNGKILANGQAEGYITVIARDEDGDTLEGASVRLRADSDHPEIEQTTVVTNSDGEAEFTIRSREAESVTFSASSTGNTLSETSDIRFVTVDPDQTIIVAEPDNVQADGEEVSTITVITRDEDGDVLPGARVGLEAMNGTSVIDDANQITNDEGETVFRVTNHQPEIVGYKVTAENIELPGPLEIGFIPIAPVALSANHVENRSFRANWEVVDGAEYYLLDVSEDSSFATVLSDYNARNIGNTTSYEVSEISPGTMYMYRVRAVSDGLIGANSQIITTTTFPDTPVTSAPSEVNALEFTANWNEAEGAESYRIDVATDFNFQFLLPAYDNYDAGSDTQHTITNLEPGSRYYYRVRSVAIPRTSSHSNVSETTTLTISTDQSAIESEQLRVLANGLQPNPVYITVKSDEGVLLRGLSVDFTVTEGDAQIDIEPVQPTTDEEGIAIFNVTSASSGTVRFNVTTEGVDLGQLTVEFLTDSGELELGNNYPNPFLIETTLPVTVPTQMHLQLQVFNAIGIPIQTVLDEEFEAGYYEIPFQGHGLAAGVYFFRLTASGEVITNKMVLIK